MTTHHAMTRLSVARLAVGMIVLAVGLAAMPMTAHAQGLPFIKTDSAPSCEATASGTACTFVFPKVPGNRRWEITHAACRTNLLNANSSSENATLTRTGNGAPDYPLLPIKIANGNQWVVSQSVLVPLDVDRRAIIRIQSFGGAVVGNAGVCTISGRDIALQ